MDRYFKLWQQTADIYSITATIGDTNLSWNEKAIIMAIKRKRKKKSRQSSSRHLQPTKRQISDDSQDHPLIQETNALVKTGKYADAMELLKEALNLHPDDPGLTRQLIMILVQYNDLGVQYMAEEKLSEAQAIFNKINTIKPFPETYRNLGVIAVKQHQFETAITHFDAVLSLSPNHGEAMFFKGNAYYWQGRYEDAVVIFKKVIDLYPEHKDARTNLGIALEKCNAKGLEAMREGKLDEACRIFTFIDAIHSFGSVLYNLGLVYLQQARLEDAKQAFMKSLDVEPNNAEVWFKLGNTCFQLESYREAIPHYQKALAISPGFEDAANNISVALNHVNNQGVHLMAAGDIWEAKEIFEFILSLRDLAPVHYNLGTIYQEQKETDKAIYHLQRAQQLAPERSDIRYNLGMCLYKKGRLNEAASCFEEAMAINPMDPDNYGGMGLTKMAVCDIDGAVAWYHKGLAVDPDHADIHRNLAMAHLFIGNFETGWEEYEWRWRTADMAPQRRFHDKPLWEGGDLNGKRICVWGEQGIGDEISFSAMIPDLIDTGANIIIESEPRLMPLFQRSFPGVTCVSRGKHHPVDWDVHLPMASLGRFFRKKAADFPQTNTYLKPDTILAAELKKKYAPDNLFLVGISWRTRSPGRYNYESLEDWAPILSVPGVRFVNLQYGNCDEDLDQVKKKLGIDIYHDPHIDPLKDMDTFAAQVSAMDLVVSIDNSTVVLAAALGKPVWTLLPRYSTYFQWLNTGEQTIWYPTMTLIRQTPNFGWKDVCQKVIQDLNHEIRGAMPN